MNAVTAAIEAETEYELSDELLEDLASEDVIGRCPACGSRLHETYLVHDEWEFRCECGFKGKCE